MPTAPSLKLETLRTLPTDAARQIQWRFADRYDLQMLVQSARSVARGPVAKLVAQGGRNTHEWTADKADLLEAFDRSGITAVFMDPEQGGFIAGPRNMALALVAFELAWVDGGAATARAPSRPDVGVVGGVKATPDGTTDRRRVPSECRRRPAIGPSRRSRLGPRFGRSACRAERCGGPDVVQG